MAITATAGSSGTFTPAPAGVHQAVCVDVIDLGMLESAYLDQQGRKKVQHKINIAWQITKLRDDGKRFVLYKRYTLSLNEKATLRKDLESWRGRPFTRDEELGFDVERVKGANCLINVQHNANGDKTYANVVSVMPLIAGMPKIVAEGYVRPERADTSQATNAEPTKNDHHDQSGDDSDERDDPFGGSGAPTTITDDDIPF
jgi:hypothetical protein